MKKKNKRKEKMHNNKINKDGFEKGDFIYIKKQDDVLPWKDFNKNMAVSIEYNLEY